MEVYEIVGFETGISQAGVNFIQPSDSFQSLVNGFIYRQKLQSRQGVGYFCPRLAGQTRVLGIFEHTLPDSSKMLLAFDKNFLYKYNTTSGVFDQIAFGGSMAAYEGFKITENDFYISGTSYPTATNGARFVFCGEGITPNANGSAIFEFITDPMLGDMVVDFTDSDGLGGGDNPDYDAPPQGQLSSAVFCMWFNERMNFIVPVIAGITYEQGILYSGIRTASGNGDKFNVSGSGLFQADTYQYITGATILGQIIVLHFDRMAYTLEKTKDAFNPYFGRAVPGALGTNARFSPVSWNESDQALGKTGVLSCDGRQNLRVDNKIPNFTRDEIDQINFNLTYGGFDRVNNQFMWAYMKSESDTDTQNSVLIKNYEERTWSVYDQRFSVLGQTDIGLNLTWDDIDETTGNDSWLTWDTTEDIWDRIGLGLAVQKTLAGDDLGFIYNVNQDYCDYFSAINSVTTGATTLINVANAAMIEGDIVIIQNVLGMTELNNFDPATNEMIGDYYTVISATDTVIEINVDSRLYTPYISDGSISKVISFEATTIPFNPYRNEGRRCYVSHLEFLIDTNGGHVYVDAYADEQTTPFKRNVLLKPTKTAQAREWMTMTIGQEANFLTFVFKQTSAAVQLTLTSIRIHCSKGGMTDG